MGAIKDKEEDINKRQVEFYQEQMSKIQKYIKKENLGKLGQSFFDIMWEHIQDLKSKSLNKN